MSGVPTGRYYDTTRDTGTWQGLADLVFVAAGLDVVVTNPQTPLTVPLIANKGPDVNTVPGANAAYLVIRNVIVSVGSDPRKAGYREALSKVFNFSVAPGSSTTTLQLTTTSANERGALALAAVSFLLLGTPAGVSVPFLNLDRNDGVFLPCAVSPQVSSPALVVVSLIPQFGPYGFEALALSSGGLRAQIGWSNSNGVAEPVSVVLSGSQLAADLSAFDVVYNDPNGILTIPVAQGLQGIGGAVSQAPLNLRLPVPFTDPGNGNFGQLVITPTNYSQFYDTQKVVEITVLASLMYQLAGGV